MSFRSKLLLACLLSSSSVFLQALASEESLSRSSSSPQSTLCRLRVGNHVYDLCPLLEKRGLTLGVPTTRSRLGESESSTESYIFGATGESSCPENTVVCWNNPEMSSPIAVASSVGLTAILKSNSFDEPFILELKGTTYNSKLQFTRIEFICDEDVDDDRSEPSSLPTFVGRYNGVHHFSWRSIHACPRKVYDSTMTITALDEDPQPITTVLASRTRLPSAEQSNTDEDKDNEDQDSFTDPLAPSDARRKAAIILLIIGLIIITIVYLIHCRPARTLLDTYIRPSLTRISTLAQPRSLSEIHVPTISSHTFTLSNVKNLKLPSFNIKRSRRRHSLRPYRFRVGENRLVQWATEDSRLINETGEGEEYDFEEDFMVNGFDEEVDGTYFDEGEGAARGINGEYVPLSVGMGWAVGSMKSGGKKNYGTAGKKMGV